MKTVLLLTESFPLGGITEEAFVRPEIEALSQEFDRVIVVPVSQRGSLLCALPENVTVAREIIDSIVWRKKWMRPLVHPVAVVCGRDDIRYALSSAVVESSIKSILKTRHLSPADTVMEAFWFDFAASALGRISKRYGYKFRVRAHRYDIFTDRAPRQRLQTISESSGVYAVSNSGAEWLRSRYPSVATKISTAYLGVDPAEKEARHSEWGMKCVRLLTVARINDVKRCHVCLEFVKALAIARPQWKFEWTLIGDGPEASSLRTQVESVSRDNLIVNLLGELTHDKVMDYYSTATTDWFMLLSRSEGLSIAVLEAMTRGIPVIATDVGGMAEAVDDSTGLLLAPDPEPEEFVRGLMPYLDSRARYEALCTGARRKVAELFDASRLRREWARELKTLIE